MWSVLASLLPVTVMLAGAHGNYRCLCNYDVEHAVREQPDPTANVRGYLYEFDCKPITGDKINDWFPIAMNHKIGYVHSGGNIQLQTCPGSPSSVDVVKSTPHTQTTSKEQFTSSTSTTIASTSSTSTTASTTRTTTTHAPTTSSKFTPSQTITTVQPKQPTRIITQTPSTSFVSLKNTATTQPLSTTQQQLVVGNATLCPAILHQYTREDQGALTQYGNRCFEIVPIRAIWAKAENDCRAKGGHLFHIDDKAQQDFIYKWIKSYNFDHAVWTGLHDLLNEEYFQWISGDHLRYTNWYPDRYGNLASHHIENCVLMVPYAPYYGQWDDVQCGISTFLGDSGQQNPFICEYCKCLKRSRMMCSGSTYLCHCRYKTHYTQGTNTSGPRWKH